MRIACLQFAPQAGEVDNNLNRADAVLAKANQDDIDSLDLLVLPELAFSGHNFGSYDEIAAYLEPSGSGISSLWARTIALKHNTNVLVGYPEQIDASGSSRAGPKQFNSAILVNGDGETVANYRKSFLHSSDESWAREGKDFFGDHVPGLGDIAIGIGADINPYKLKAPWHAFEFAFHILDVRANLAIVNMAWFTNEECAQFTQFPNEPDMDALAYWARRLEPIIRDESREELIIVFCNRTGIEDETTVYAGTSAVIGIHQGEVKVYGLLGRGVKELLIVDTDEPPFANLTIRKDGVHLSPMEYELKTSEHSDGADGLLFKPSPINPGRRTPTKCFPGAAKSKVASTSVPEEGIPEAISPSVSVRSQPLETHMSPNTGRILGGSVEITFEDCQDAPEQGSTLDPPSPSSDSPPAPSERSLSQGPQPLGIFHKPTIYIQYPGRAESPRPRDPSPRPQNDPALSDRYAEVKESCLSREVSGVSLPSRPNTATGIRPPRPASPKSQNASIIQARSQSMAAERRVLNSNLIGSSQRSSNSRSTSRPGRIIGLDQGLIERALDFYLGSKSVDARDRNFVIASHVPRARSPSAKRQSVHADSSTSATMSDDSSSFDRSTSTARSEPAQSDTIAAESHKEFDESRTVLWQEDSQIVGHESRRSKSKEGVRGRRRSRGSSPTGGGREFVGNQSAGSTDLADTSQNRPSSRPSTSGGQYKPASGLGRASPAQFRPRNTHTIRSVRDPSLGPPSDSEDEIIAEITFRRPACRNCGSSNCDSRNASGPRTQDASTTAVGPVSNQQANKVAGTSKPLSPSPSTTHNEKTPTMDKFKAVLSDPVRLALQTTSEELNDLRAPNLSRGSLRTLSSYEPSPVTPPPRHFEPRTPKAMIFPAEYALASIEAVSNPTLDAVNTSLDDVVSICVDRPKVSV